MSTTMLSKEYLNSIVTPWGEVGYITYKRTYARRLIESDVDSKTEEFRDTIDRVVDATESQLNVGFTEEERSLGAFIVFS